MFQAAIDDHKRWRIIFVSNGEQRDICGAVDEAVAWAQADILNWMRRSR